MADSLLHALSTASRRTCDPLGATAAAGRLSDSGPSLTTCSVLATSGTTMAYARSRKAAPAMYLAYLRAAEDAWSGTIVASRLRVTPWTRPSYHFTVPRRAPRPGARGISVAGVGSEPAQDLGLLGGELVLGEDA